MNNAFRIKLRGAVCSHAAEVLLVVVVVIRAAEYKWAGKCIRCFNVRESRINKKKRVV